MALNLDDVRALADRVARSHGLDIVDIEYQGGGGKYRTLRIFVEKNQEERARLLAMAAASAEHRRAAAGSLLEDVDPTEFEDDPEVEGDEDEEFGETAQGGDDGDEDDEQYEQDEQDEDDDEYDHEAFLRSLPSVTNLEHLSGVTHTDCEQFSRDFGTVLDVEELVPGTEYLLEVSSPGLDRRLQKEADFRRFAGSVIKVQTFEPVSGNRHWQGRLTTVEEGTLTIIPVEDRKQKKAKKAVAGSPPVEISLANVEKANLVPEF